MYILDLPSPASSYCLLTTKGQPCRFFFPSVAGDGTEAQTHRSRSLSWPGSRPECSCFAFVYLKWELERVFPSPGSFRTGAWAVGRQAERTALLTRQRWEFRLLIFIPALPILLPMCGVPPLLELDPTTSFLEREEESTADTDTWKVQVGSAQQRPQVSPPPPISPLCLIRELQCNPPTPRFKCLNIIASRFYGSNCWVVYHFDRRGQKKMTFKISY